MLINKQFIKKSIGQGKLKQAIEGLEMMAQQSSSDLLNTVILQSARYQSLKNDEMMGIVTKDQVNRTSNSITYSLLNILDELEETIEYDSDEPDEIEDVRITRTILFVSSNPKDYDPLRLGEEMSRMTESIRMSGNADNYEIKQEWATKVKSLRRAMLLNEPFLVHFSGHGSSEGGILLEDNEGYGHAVELAALGSFFSLFKDSLHCVLLNSCYSEAQAKEISKYIPYVIGIKGEVPDSTSAAFSEAFYDGLGIGKSIEDSFRIAVNTIEMNSRLDGADLPVLLIKADN